MCRGSRFAGHYCVHPAGSSCPLVAVGLVWPVEFWPAGRPVNVPGLTIRRTLLRSPCGQLLSPCCGWPGVACGVLARRASGECAGAHDSPDTTAFTLRAALVPLLRLAWCGLWSFGPQGVR